MAETDEASSRSSAFSSDRDRSRIDVNASEVLLRHGTERRVGLEAPHPSSWHHFAHLDAVAILDGVMRPASFPQSRR